MGKKKTITLTLCLAVIGALNLTLTGHAKEKGLMKEIGAASIQEQKGSPNGDMDPAMAEMMAQWQKYMTPGEGHKVLENLVGKWSHTLQHWMSADSPADETNGTSEISWILGGRFVQHSVNGEWNGQPFQGLGIIGFDNITKQYNTVWLDNMGTGIMQANGKYDAVTNSIGEAGMFSCPMTNSLRQYRAVTKFIDKNTFTYETFMTDETGKEFRSMRITYTRS